MRQQQCHAIRANHGTRTPGRAIFIDTVAAKLPIGGRSEGHRLVLRMGVAVCVRMVKGTPVSVVTHKHKSGQTLWQQVADHLHHREPTWVISSNLVHDLTLLRFWSEMENGRFRVAEKNREHTGSSLPGSKHKRGFRGTMVLERMPSFIVAKHSRGVCKFADSHNYYNMPSVLFDAAPLCDTGRNPQTPRDDDADTRECENRVRRLAGQITDLWRMWREEDLGVFQLTAAKLSMTSFRHRHMTHRIIPPQDAEVRKLERASYYGGRVEAFYVGDIQSPAGDGDPVELWTKPIVPQKPIGPVRLLDIRSLYPSVMRDGSYPTRLLKVYDSPSNRDAFSLIEAFGCIASVSLRTDHERFPYRNCGETVYASGRFDTVLAGAELKWAMVSRSIHRVHRLHTYQCEYLFTGWVDCWWGRRIESEKRGDVGRAAFCKLILNSLSGKWAQQSPRWVDSPDVPDVPGAFNWCQIDADTGITNQYRSIFGHVQRKDGTSEPTAAFPAISAFITAAGRMRMRGIFGLCPRGSLLYTDTDSVITTDTGYAALLTAGEVSPSRIGKLAEKWRERAGHIAGLRNYLFGDKRILSSIPVGIIPGADGTVKFAEKETPTEIVGRIQNGEILERMRTVRISEKWTHGRINEFGWVQPLVLPCASGSVLPGNG